MVMAAAREWVAAEKVVEPSETVLTDRKRAASMAWAVLEVERAVVVVTVLVGVESAEAEVMAKVKVVMAVVVQAVVARVAVAAVVQMAAAGSAAHSRRSRCPEGSGCTRCQDRRHCTGRCS